VIEPAGHDEAAIAVKKTPRRRSLYRGEAGELVLSYYSAGHLMAAHSHDVDQCSIILSGGLSEETPSRAACPGAGQSGFKPAGLRHENRYGPNGALILALNMSPQSKPGLDWNWARTGVAPQIGALMPGLLDQSDAEADTVQDLIALMSEPGEPANTKGVAPAWLLRVREAVLESPDAADLESLAEEAGVHRAHLSRAYCQHFGAPVSQDRRLARLGRAINALLEHGARPADAAFDAGFADQPHLSRTLKAQTGLTPRLLMRAFTEAGRTQQQVTNVQDRCARSA
jgi:AraC family transcriptional regulator